MALAGQLADMDLRLLRIYKAVIEAGGFTAAELTLNLANSTISNYIADLEKRLDMRLCERGRAGFHVTPQGRVVYDAVLVLLGAVDQFRNTINQVHNRLIGELHLGLAEHMLGAQHSRIVAAVKQFSEHAPDVRLTLLTMDSDEVTRAVLDKRIDIGVTVITSPYAELNHQALFTEEMLIYCGEGHPLFDRAAESVTPADLRPYKFAESPRLLPGREAHAESQHWNIHAKAHHQEARVMLILSGHYLGYLPRHLVQHWGLAQRLRPLLADRFGYRNNIEAIHRPHHPNTVVIEAFMQCLQSAASS